MQRTAISYKFTYGEVEIIDGAMVAVEKTFTAFNAFNLDRAHKMFTKATGYGAKVIKKTERIEALYEMPDERFFTNAEVKNEKIEEI